MTAIITITVLNYMSLFTCIWFFHNLFLHVIISIAQFNDDFSTDKYFVLVIIYFSLKSVLTLKTKNENDEICQVAVHNQYVSHLIWGYSEA